MNALLLAMLAMLLVTPANEYTVLMEVTAYCPCALCCEVHASVPFDERRTAGGYPLAMVTAMVAAPRGYPYETAMSVPGYAATNWVHVLDRGGAIKGNRLDVYFHSHRLARQWGRRMVWVTVRGYWRRVKARMP